MIKPLVAAVGLMSFLPTHLAVDAGFKVAAPTTATTTLLVTTSRATTSTAATATIVGEVATTMATLCSDVGGRVRAAIADLTALLIAHKLSLKFLKRDGFDTVGHAGHHQVKLLLETHENVGHDLVVF